MSISAGLGENTSLSICQFHDLYILEIWRLLILFRIESWLQLEEFIMVSCFDVMCHMIWATVWLLNYRFGFWLRSFSDESLSRHTSFSSFTMCVILWFIFLHLLCHWYSPDHQPSRDYWLFLYLWLFMFPIGNELSSAGADDLQLLFEIAYTVYVIVGVLIAFLVFV